MTESSTSELLEQGDALLADSQFESAIACFAEVVRLAPDLTSAHTRLANTYLQQGSLDEAERALKYCLENTPDNADCISIQADIFARRGNHSKAESLHRQVLARKIDHFPSHLNLARVLHIRGLDQSALHHALRACQLRPDAIDAKYFAAQLLKDAGRETEAIEIANSILATDPGSEKALRLLGLCELSRGEVLSAHKILRLAVSRAPKGLDGWPSLLGASNYIGGDKSETFKLHTQFGELLTEHHAKNKHPDHHNKPNPGKKIRVGFVSADLRLHSVSYFVQAALSKIDHSLIEIRAYYNNSYEDARSHELMHLFDEWRTIHHLNDVDASELIRRDGIDILVDLSGASRGNRLGIFALKPAPLQATWIGYPNTTGLPTVDYRITDALTDPPALSDKYHSETLLRLPECFLCYAPPPDAPEVSPPPSLSKGAITFGSFNNRLKISEETLAIWGQVMSAVPDARLLIKSMSGLGQSERKKNLLDALTRQGISPDRVILHTDKSTVAEHLALYSDIDICLDTYPYHGTTTTCEALWMGCPVITLAGDRHASRVGVSLLTNIGLSRFVAHDIKHYVQIAAELVRSKEKLATLRLSMRPRMKDSVLLNSQSMGKKLENAFRHIWAEYCERHPDTPVNNAKADRDTWTLDMIGDYKIVVAKDFKEQVSSWITLEQESWYEEEIRFIADICRPDWQALDIGANHGIYSLALAGAGARKIWAFEPVSEPRLRFRDSVTTNDFERQISILPYGLSTEKRTYSLQLAKHCEANSLNHTPMDVAGHETVMVEILDELAEKTFPEVCFDFVKIDNGGDEMPVLRGGLRFFLGQSPLVMFNVNLSDAQRSFELINSFRSMGYGIYRYLPALNCLFPISPGIENTLDESTANLFACKKDQAKKLADAGKLACDAAQRQIALHEDWAETLTTLPLFQDIPIARWKDVAHDDAYRNSMLAWCGSRQTTLALADRFALLNQGFRHYLTAVNEHNDYPEVAIVGARLADDLGMRTKALEIARGILERYPTAKELTLAAPVPPLDKRFDSALSVQGMNEFIHQSIMEFVLVRGVATQFLENKPSELLALALTNPKRSARIERCAVLAGVRNQQALKLAPTAKIFHLTPDNLNPAIWKHIASEHGFIDHGDPHQV